MYENIVSAVIQHLQQGPETQIISVRRNQISVFPVRLHFRLITLYLEYYLEQSGEKPE